MKNSELRWPLPLKFRNVAHPHIVGGNIAYLFSDPCSLQVIVYAFEAKHTFDKMITH